MKNRSVIITTNIVAVLAILFAMFGLPIDKGAMMETVETFMRLSSMILAFVMQIINWADRYKKGDVGMFGKRLKKTNQPIDPVE